MGSNADSRMRACGFMSPLISNKVNQDRSVEIVKFGGNDEKAFFGVFDGHGSLGHEVSSFLIQELPKFFLKQPNLDANPHEAITKAFIGQTPTQGGRAERRCEGPCASTHRACKLAR